jgi:uncharacterized membrane protein
MYAYLTYVLALLIGVTAGLRSLTAPAVVSWAARLGWLHLDNTPLAFLGFAATPYILSVLAIVELVADKLPKTPSRTAPPGLIARIVTGGVCGAAFGAPAHDLIFTGLAGVLGALAGAYRGRDYRVRFAKAFGKDLPVALIEDVIAIGGAFLICSR